MRALVKTVPGFIEPDVAVVSDSEKLKVRASDRCHNLIIFLARRLNVVRKPVRHMRPCLVNIDMIKQLMIHEIAVALLVIAAKADILVQIAGCNL